MTEDTALQNMSTFELQAEVARLSGWSGYLGMHAWFKRQIGWPVTDAEMRQYIVLRRIAIDVEKEVFGG